MFNDAVEIDTKPGREHRCFKRAAALAASFPLAVGPAACSSDRTPKLDPAP
jgi:hypothetical protein